MKTIRGFPVRSVLALLILLTVGVVWKSREQQIAAKRQTLTAAHARLGQLTSRLEDAQKEIDHLRHELASTREQRLSTLVQVKQTEEALSRPSRDDKWADAPAGSPTWNADSPYAWLSKSTLSGLASNPFHKDGALRQEFADALAINDMQRRKVTDVMRGLVNDFQSLQVAHAERTVSPPKREGESEEITVRIPAMPEQSARLQAQLEAALEAELGTQRKELLMNVGRLAIQSKLNAFGQREEKIAAKRRKDGAYEIRMGDGMMSGPPRLNDHIPPHLLPFFADIQPSETQPDRPLPAATNPEQQQRGPRLDLSFEPSRPASQQ